MEVEEAVALVFMGKVLMALLLLTGPVMAEVVDQVAMQVEMELVAVM